MADMTNAQALNASEGLAGLSKIGSRDEDTIKRLAKMIIFVRTAIEEYFVQRDALVNGHAKRDDDGNIVTRPSEDGKGQVPVVENEVEYNLAKNSLMRGKAKIEGTQPAPFSFADLKKFTKMPDAMTISALGPFIVID